MKQGGNLLLEVRVLHDGLIQARRKDRQRLSEQDRKDVLEHGDFLRLLGNLPDYIKPVVEFLYLSGWRKGEAVRLEWRDVDLKGGAVRLRIENSKNKESRILPLTGRLRELIQERADARRLDCPFVFHCAGQKIGDFRKVWRTACVAAGLGKAVKVSEKKTKYIIYTIPHDLRRCAARNLSRAGVPEQVAMGITGHKTNSMYRRYRIVDERDLREATEKLHAHLAEQAKSAVVAPLQGDAKTAVG